MKIVFLNCWDATMGENLRGFILRHRDDTDIFCFQEAEEKFVSFAKELLENFEFTQATTRGLRQDRDNYTNCTYIRKDLGDVQSQPLLVHEEGCGVGLYSEVGINGKTLSLVNFHGQWKPGTKIDTEIRLRQSQLLIDFLRDKEGLHIIGGDFNLLLDTESVRMFEQAGYKNLIRDWDIKTTRNQISWSVPGNEKQLWADFVFVSPDVQVKSFVVPEDDESSDHLPMILELDL